MKVVVLHLAFSNLEQLTNSELHTLMVIGVHLEYLVHGNSSVKTHQKGFEDTLPSFQVEIHDLHPEDEGDH